MGSIRRSWGLDWPLCSHGVVLLTFFSIAGPAGPRGDPGATGVAGPIGPPGVAGGAGAGVRPNVAFAARTSAFGVLEWSDVDSLTGSQSLDFDRELVIFVRRVTTPYVLSDDCRYEFRVLLERYGVFYGSSADYQNRGHTVRGRTLGQRSSDHLAFVSLGLGYRWRLSQELRWLDIIFMSTLCELLLRRNLYDSM